MSRFYYPCFLYITGVIDSINEDKKSTISERENKNLC